MTKNKKHLAERAAAPRLSELLSEAHEWLKAIDGSKRHVILVYETDDDISTRIIPVTGMTMKEMLEGSDHLTRYKVRTDGNHKLIKEE